MLQMPVSGHLPSDVDWHVRTLDHCQYEGANSLSIGWGPNAIPT